MRSIALVTGLLLTATAQAATPEEASELLQLHNGFRAYATEGTSLTMPAAADMQALVWDPALAELAQDHADTCSYGVDSDRSTAFYTHAALASFGYPAAGIQLGQNIGFAGGSFDYPPSSDVFDLWSGEEADFQYIPIGTTSNTYGHVSQLVWADTRYVGCGVSTCFDSIVPNFYATYVVCNYYPAGNWFGQLPYTSGTPSAATCPPDRPLVADGLCDGCPDPDHILDGSASPPDTCMPVPDACTVDADCEVLDYCADDDGTEFAHTCAGTTCQLTVVDCGTGSCAAGTCGACPDADGDTVCDDLDLCTGDDATGDADADGVCDDLDLCEGDDALGDADVDGFCDATLTVTNLVSGGDVVFDIVGARPGARVYLMGSTRGAGSTCHPNGAVCVDIRRAQLLRDGIADAAGDATFVVTLPATVPAGTSLAFQALWLDSPAADTTNAVFQDVQ